MLSLLVKPKLSDQNILIQFILIYFFIHIVIYLSHNSRETLVKETFNIRSNQYSVIEMISGIKLLGSIVSSYISQKYIRPLAVMLIATVVFVVSLFVVITKVIENINVNLFIGCLHIIADSSILPSLDSECLILLNKRGIGEKFSKIRMFSTIGHSLAYLISILTRKMFGTVEISKAVLTNTLLFGIITAGCIIYSLCTIEYDTAPEVEKKDTQRETESRSFRERLADIFSIVTLFRIDYTIMIIAAVGSGVSRSSLQSYLSEYLRSTRSSVDEQNWIYFVRTICELFVWSVVIWLGDRVSLEGLFPIAISLGAVRALCYSIIPANKVVWRSIPYIAEIFKSAYSALFIYVCTKLAHKYAGPNQKALSQGVFTGFYSGISPFLAGILSYYVFSFSEKTDSEKREDLFKFTGCIGLAAASLSTVLYVRRARKALRI